MNECVPPLAAQINNYFKTRISTEILNDDDSMSEQETNIENDFIGKKGYKKKHADSIEQ